MQSLVGSESGPKARPIKKEWVEFVQQECEKHQVPFFLKQWGKKKFNPDPEDPTTQTGHENYAKGGCLLDKQLYREMPVV